MLLSRYILGLGLQPVKDDHFVEVPGHTAKSQTVLLTNQVQSKRFTQGNLTWALTIFKGDLKLMLNCNLKLKTLNINYKVTSWMIEANPTPN